MPYHDEPVPAHTELHERVAHLLEENADRLQPEGEGLQNGEIVPRPARRHLQSDELGVVVEERDAAAEQNFPRVDIEKHVFHVVDRPE